VIRKLLATLAGLAIVLGVVLVTLLNWPLPKTPRPGVAGDFLVRNVAVVDVANDRIVPGRDVTIRNGRIDSVGASIPEGGQRDLIVVDGAGKFLIPGLWDMHVHSLKISPQFTHPLAIANGITGVREMWGCPALPDSFVACGEDIERWRAQLRDRSHLAPRYIMRSSFAINGEQGVPAAAPAFFKARNADEARALVAHHAAAGVDLLKTYTNISLAAYEALAAEASKRGLLVAGHLPVRVPLETVLAAGQQSGYSTMCRPCASRSGWSPTANCAPRGRYVWCSMRWRGAGLLATEPISSFRGDVAAVWVCSQLDVAPDTAQNQRFATSTVARIHA
jgi:hypothetical protein